MNFKPRFIRALRPEELTPDVIQEASGGYQVHLGITQEVHLVHFGEDGPMLVLAELRGPMYLEKEQGIGVFQDWYVDELMQDIYFEDLPELEVAPFN